MNIENDIRAHHLQNYMLAGIHALHSGHEEESGTAISRDTILRKHLDDIASQMVNASFEARDSYRLDTVGTNEEGADALKIGIQFVVDQFAESNGMITIGNLRDPICASCIIGNHCLEPRGGKDENLIEFLKKVLQRIDTEFTYSENIVEINNRKYNHIQIQLKAQTIRHIVYSLSKFLYKQIVEYVYNVNNVYEKIGSQTRTSLDDLITERDSIGLTPSAVISDFILDESTKDSTVDMFIDFMQKEI